MLNQVVLVGRLEERPFIYEDKVMFRLKVQKSYKNAEGVYENDVIKCESYGTIGTHILENIKAGDLIGVKGRLSGYDIVRVIAEKVSHLSSSTNE